MAQIRHEQTIWTFCLKVRAYNFESMNKMQSKVIIES